MAADREDLGRMLFGNRNAACPWYAVVRSDLLCKGAQWQEVEGSLPVSISALTCPHAELESGGL